jgi:tRNA-Thr(GGU) m(6)t(6)A37 methyltransferase TsaA
MFVIEPVGHVRSSRATIEDDEWGAHRSFIELTAAFDSTALTGLTDFSHVEVIYFFDRVPLDKITTGARHPRNNPNWPNTGIFAQRAKNRPNRLGSTIAKLVGVSGTTLEVLELDAIDGTPVIDIKPVMVEFLPRGPVRQPEWSAELMGKYWVQAMESYEK